MPSWTPMCKCMQVYCEPFFVAINRWRTCGNEELMRNRLALCETAFEIMNEYSQAQQNIEFDLVSDEQVELEPEVIPTAGREYIFGGDRVAYEAARNLVPASIFNRVGIFFQQNLLKGMAGNGDSYLATCNDFNRKSIISAIEKLFRLPMSAGKAHFVKRFVDDKNSKFKNHSTVTISTNGNTFGDTLLESVKRVAVSPPASKKETTTTATNGKKRKDSSATADASSSKKAKTAAASSAARENDDGESDWTTDHSSVGTQVANYFTLPGGRKLFRGEVVKYAPPTKPRGKDQLYHIVWEDGDEEDYDEGQMQTGVGLYVRHFAPKSSPPPAAPKHHSPAKAVRESAVTSKVQAMDVDEEEDEAEEDWTTDHPSVGTKVAAVFTIKRKSTIYRGHVTRYCPPSAPAEQDQLYHIKWEDSDEEDYDEGDLQRGIDLYAKKFGKDASAAAAAATADSSSSSSSSSAAANDLSPSSSSSSSSSSSAAAAGSASASKYSSEKSAIVAVKYDTPEWTERHASVGTAVAMFFPPSGKNKTLYCGVVTKYGRESFAHARDHLYHVVFEDGDACDVDEDSFQQGVALYQLHGGHKKHSSASVSASANQNEATAADAADQDIEIADNHHHEHQQHQHHDSAQPAENHQHENQSQSQNQHEAPSVDESTQVLMSMYHPSSSSSSSAAAAVDE